MKKLMAMLFNNDVFSALFSELKSLVFQNRGLAMLTGYKVV